MRVILASVLALVTLGTAVASQQIVDLAPDSTLTANCPTNLRATVTPQQSVLVCDPQPAHPNHWHGPTVHEHGDEPPQWVTDWSQATFRHGVIYGGNETSSPMENGHKHEAFKGVILQSVAGGEFYLRYHAASNPLDRSAQHHSFEVYYQDTQGGVSFLEGWYDTGDPTDPQRRCALPNANCGGQRPIILMSSGNEQWYAAHGLASFGINIGGPTTSYGGLSENMTAHDRATWKLTGGLGTTRVGASTEVFLADRFRQLGSGVHCLTAFGVRGACDELHPFRGVVAPTLGADYRTEYNIPRISTIRQTRSYPCPQCQVPN